MKTKKKNIIPADPKTISFVREYSEIILDTIKEPLIVLDPDLKVISASRSFYETFKVKPEETKGRFIYDLGNRQWDIPELRKLLEDILPKISAFDNYEIEHDFQTIGRRTMLLNARRLDKMAMILIAIDDITERKKAEEIKKTDQMRSDFISTISHELRTPLSITKEGISLVLDKIAGDINEKQKGILGTAKNNIDRLAGIIDELLDTSKIEAGRVELKRGSVDMAGLIRQAVSSFELSLKKKGLELRVNIPEKQVDAYVDPDKISQCFTNLIGNALKFTDKGHIDISLEEKEKEIECFVADTGIGIAKEDLPRVFNKFEQFGRLSGAGEKGTGLGLSITKGIIELHGGRIRVESEPGRGTKFIFNLPKYSAEEILREYLNNGMKEAMKGKACMALIVISISEFNGLKQKYSDEKLGAILRSMEELIKGSIRRDRDVVLKGSGGIAIILAGCGKEDSLIIENRLKEALDMYLSNEELSEKIKLRFGSAVYPDEAENIEELIKKAKEA
jgi:diguanylate cyclase (GGDEF)-like protein